jgi:hypothetical protein
MNYDITSILHAVAWVIVMGFISAGLYWILRQSTGPWQMALRFILSPLMILGEVMYIRKAENYDPYVAAFSIAGSVAACSWVLGLIWIPTLVDTLFRPLTDLFDGGNLPPEKKPLYSMAIAKRKAGHPLEAVVELRRQLADFPQDTEGVFMLAAIQAEDLMDLPGAEITMTNFCETTDASPRQISAAYTQLADWHLRLAHDVSAACAAWQQIIDRFPGTDLAQMAENRIAHAADAEKHILEVRDNRTILVPEGPTDLGLREQSSYAKPKEASRTQQANDLVKQLEKYPLDTEARESLAMLYANEFQRLDLATLELNQLIEGPNHQPKQITRWLNLRATLQIKLGADELTVRTSLKEIVRRFPKSTYAQLAQKRIEQIANELRLQKQTPSKKLGVYDQNRGL